MSCSKAKVFFSCLWDHLHFWEQKLSSSFPEGKESSSLLSLSTQASHLDHNYCNVCFTSAWMPFLISTVWTLHSPCFYMNYRDILVYHNPSPWPYKRFSAQDWGISSFSTIWDLIPSLLNLVPSYCPLHVSMLFFSLTRERFEGLQV